LPRVFEPAAPLNAVALRQEFAGPLAEFRPPAKTPRFLRVGRGEESLPHSGRRLGEVARRPARHIEIHDDARSLRAAAAAHGRRVLLRAGAGHRPLLVWEPAAEPASALLPSSAASCYWTVSTWCSRVPRPPTTRRSCAASPMASSTPGIVASPVPRARRKGWRGLLTGHGEGATDTLFWPRRGSDGAARDRDGSGRVVRWLPVRDGRAAAAGRVGLRRGAGDAAGRCAARWSRARRYCGCGRRLDRTACRSCSGSAGTRCWRAPDSGRPGDLVKPGRPEGRGAIAVAGAELRVRGVVRLAGRGVSVCCRRHGRKRRRRWAR